MRTWLPRIGYLALGLFLVLALAPITWNLVSRSVDTGDYVLAVFFCGVFLVIVGMLFLKRWQPRVSFQTLDGRTSVKFGFDRRYHGERPQDFHPWKPWKLPYTTTRRALWLRATLPSLVSAAIVIVIWCITDWGVATPLAGASVLLVGVPFEYRRLRRQYEPAQTGDDASGHLRYKGPAKLNWRETALMMILFASILVVITVGLLLRLND